MSQGNGQEEEPGCPLKTKPPWFPNHPAHQFCGTQETPTIGLANVKVFVVINWGRADEVFVESLFTAHQHKRDHAAAFTLSASSKILLKKGDTVQVLVVPGPNGEKYRANANACSLTIERVRQFD